MRNIKNLNESRLGHTKDNDNNSLDFESQPTIQPVLLGWVQGKWVRFLLGYKKLENIIIDHVTIL